jgi:hypothetical protein
MKKTQEQILKEVFEFAESLGMNVFFNSESSYLPGFIIGTDDYLLDIVEGNEDIENYDKVLGIEAIDPREGLH